MPPAAPSQQLERIFPADERWKEKILESLLEKWVLTKTLTREPGIPRRRTVSRIRQSARRKSGNLGAHARAGRRPAARRRPPMVYRTIQGAHLAHGPYRTPTPPHEPRRAEKDADARAGHSPATNCVTKQAVSEKKSGNLGAHARAGRRPAARRGPPMVYRTIQGAHLAHVLTGHPRPVAGLSNFAERSRYRRAAAGLSVMASAYAGASAGAYSGPHVRQGSDAAKNWSAGCRGMRRAASGGPRGGAARPAPDICRRRSSAGGTQPQQRKETFIASGARPPRRDETRTPPTGSRRPRCPPRSGAAGA